MTFRAGVVLALALLTPVPAVAAGLTAHQQWAAATAVRDGGVWGETYKAIVQQESSYCLRKHSSYDPRAWGCPQLHLITARQIAPHVTVHDLMHDDTWALAIGAARLTYCMEREPTWALGVACYHYGDPTVDRMKRIDAEADDYVNTIRKHIRDNRRTPS